MAVFLISLLLASFYTYFFLHEKALAVKRKEWVRRGELTKSRKICKRILLPPAPTYLVARCVETKLPVCVCATTSTVVLYGCFFPPPFPLLNARIHSDLVGARKK